MKTKKIQKLALLCLFLLWLTGIKAQAPSCNYFVGNTGPCDLKVQVTFYDNTGNICGSPQTQTIGTGATYFNCTCAAGTLAVVRVQLLAVGGLTPSGPGIVDNTASGPLNEAGTVSGGGTCTTGNYAMSWGTTGTQINQ